MLKVILANDTEFGNVQKYVHVCVCACAGVGVHLAKNYFI